MEQPVQNGRGDDAVAEQLAPLAEPLVGGEDDAAPLVPGRHEGEEGGGRFPVVGPDAELVHDQDLGRQVDPHPPVQVCSELAKDRMRMSPR